MPRYASDTNAEIVVCGNGHPLTDSNVRRDGRRRRCRACARDRSSAYRRRRRAVRMATRRTARPPDIELAWAAGMFEGEGTVTISAAGRHGYTRPVVTLANTDRQVVDFFQARWPGRSV